MTNLRILIRSTYLSVALGLVATIVLPISLLASAEDTCVAPPDPGPGVHHPVGTDQAMYTYNCVTSKYVSAHFIYDPATSLTTPTDSLAYTYNPATRLYEQTNWVFDAPSNSYVPYVTAVATPPSGALVVGGPAPAAPTAGSGAAGGNSINGTGPGSNNTINNTGGATNGASINGTGPNSNNGINGTNTNNLNGNNNTTAGFNNTITATANTGNAVTLGNTVAGGASSGDAQDIANVVNLLQSSSNALDGNTVTFVANIDGDVNGDLLFDPAQIGSVQPAGIGGANGTNNLNLNNALDASINNNINLAANSGDATVSNNTNGGDATTGRANTIANVVNLINSAITSGKSFLGVVNINGNLNGDILIPPDFVDQLIASNVPTVSISNTGPSSNNTVNTNGGSNNTNIRNTNNESITNNVDAGATSGTATDSNNTNGGNATTGSASTNITAFNLTGSQVIGRNSLLVFVNVLGQWVGLIVNAPAGATAAELGGGITANNSNANNNTNITNNDNKRINNNITTRAKSGNANVSNNTTGGNATSGDAKGAVNLLNVEDSSLALSNWFGILFINVFGTWHGSFGINTSAGDPIAAAAGGRGADGTAAGAPGASFAPAGQFASFLPKSGSAQFSIAGTGPTNPNSISASSNATQAVNAVLAASTIKGSNAPTPQLQDARSSFTRTAAIIGSLTVIFIVADALRARRHTQR